MRTLSYEKSHGYSRRLSIGFLEDDRVTLIEVTRAPNLNGYKTPTREEGRLTITRKELEKALAHLTHGASHV